MTRLHPLPSILLGGLLLLWPVWLNAYPLLFSDTNAFLAQGGEWLALWDKPFIYGPALAWAHHGISLFIPAMLQSLIVSHLLWLLLPRHLAGCLALAVGSTLPWFTGFLMPDIFAPIVVLSAAHLALRDSGIWLRCYLILLCGFAIAVHLAHLPLAAAMLVMTLLLARRRLWRVATPLALAIATLLATNTAMFQKTTLSPHGVVFALARFAADGLVEPVLHKNCPKAGWHLCAWAGRLPTDSDVFLWHPEGPVQTTPYDTTNAAIVPPMVLTPEARIIVTATVLHDPVGVLRSMAENTLTQLHRVALGDVLTRDAAGAFIDSSITRFLGPAERERWHVSRQYQNRLLDTAERLNPVNAALMLLGLAVTLWHVWRGPQPARALALFILAALLANAAATGALSGPHDRYQARIAWLIMLPVLIRLGPPGARSVRTTAQTPPQSPRPAM